MVGYSLSGGLVMRRREFITVLGGAAAVGQRGDAGLDEGGEAGDGKADSAPGRTFVF